MIKKPKLYLVTYKTDALLLPTILQIMEGTAALVSIREAPVDVTAPTLPPPASIVRTKTSIKGMDGQKLLRQILTQGGKTVAQIETAFVETGYAGNSAKARLSEAVRAGAVIKSGDKFYLKNTVVAAGGSV